MSTLIFEEKRHRYYLEGQPEKPFTGVTTVLGVIAKPALINWASNMAVDYIAEELYVKDRQDKDAVLLEARTAYAKKRDKAGDIGTAVHLAVEEWIKEKKIPELDEQGMKMFNNFVKWAEDNNVKFLVSEKRMYSEKLWLAGTCDFTFEMNGKKYIGDLKTANAIYYEAFMQMAGYQLMLEEMGEKDFYGSCVVRIGKDGKFEVQERYDHETDKEAFLAALKLYRIINTNK